MPVLAPLLEAAGFVRYASVMQMEWRGESVTVPDSGPAHIECYAGGDLDIDRAIVDLHNWAYRPAHLVPPADLERLWKPRLGVETREYVLAMENGGRVVGYAEWLVRDGNAPVINSSDGNAPAINSIVVARSHWGTAVAAAVLTPGRCKFSSNGVTLRSSRRSVGQQCGIDAAGSETRLESCIREGQYLRPQAVTSCAARLRNQRNGEAIKHSLEGLLRQGSLRKPFYRRPDSSGRLATGYCGRARGNHAWMVF